MAEPKLVPPPPGGLVRIGRQATPLRWKNPEDLPELEEARGHLGPSASGYRFDAPHGEYRTLYFGTSVRDALIEVLAPLRPSRPNFEEKIDDFLDESPDPSHEPPPPKPLDGFFDTRAASHARVDPAARFIDVDDAMTSTALEARSGTPFLGLIEQRRYDRGLFTTQDRRVTRFVALELFEHFQSIAVGLRWASTLDASAECWVLWNETPGLLALERTVPLDVTTKDVIEAATKLGIPL